MTELNPVAMATALSMEAQPDIISNTRNGGQARHTFDHRADIDGLRSVAVVGVIIFHMYPNWLPGGFTGVDIFFVISGFVVTGSLLRPRKQHMTAGHFFLAFYSRRVKRCVQESRNV